MGTAAPVVRSSSGRGVGLILSLLVLFTPAFARADVPSGGVGEWFQLLGRDPTPADHSPEYFRGVVAQQQRLPVRDLTRDRAARGLLRRHPVFVSVTTSPARIAHLHHVVATLDLTHVTQVLVTLPATFGRTGQPYVVPAALAAHPKVTLLRVPHDLGPITKVLPALEHAARLDAKAVVISIDDDVAYPRGMVDEMVHHLAHSRDTVVGGAVPTVERYGVDLAAWRFPHDPQGHLAEGWAGIGYRAGEIDTALLRSLYDRSPETFVSDDLVINYALAMTGVRRQIIKNRYHGRKMLQLLPHGLGPDALHNGAGMATVDPALEDQNVLKYTRAIDHLNQAVAEGVTPSRGYGRAAQFARRVRAGATRNARAIPATVRAGLLRGLGARGLAGRVRGLGARARLPR